jgi:peptidase E
MPQSPAIVVLGPQRHRPTVNDALTALGLGHSGRIATVTAGWEEREDEDGELHEHLWSRSLNLELYARSDTVLREDAELRTGVRWRTERLREVQELYRIRVAHALEAARELFRREPRANGADLLVAERTGAVETLRALDAEHERLTDAVRQEFIARWQPFERSAVVRQRAEVEGLLADVPVICVAGGHVAVLLNVLRLFNFPHLVGERALVLWSAGAMALSERVVLFHDDPPQGQGSAEVLEQGLGLVRGLLPLPHASQRLKLAEPQRVALFALRFRPLLCIPLDEGSRVVWNGRGWRGLAGTRKLTEEGVLVEVGG